MVYMIITIEIPENGDATLYLKNQDVDERSIVREFDDIGAAYTAAHQLARALLSRNCSVLITVE